MKKIYILSLIIFIFAFNSCNKIDSETEIENAVQNFYKSDYKYQKTVITFENGEKDIYKFSGERINSPYKEHIMLLEEGKGESLWNEAYYYGNGDVVDALLYSNAWKKTKIKKENPYGYGEELIFVLDEKTEQNGIDIYPAKYEVNIGENYKISEHLIATVKRKYYYSQKEKCLIGIETDLTDLNEKIYMANDISINGVSLKIAQANVKDVKNLGKIENFEILDYTDEINIQVPEEN